MFCPECGSKNDENAKFCINCGYNLKSIITDIDMDEKEQEKASSSMSDMWKKCSEQIAKKVVEAYVNDKKVDRELICSRAKHYKMEAEEVEKIIAETQNAIKRVSEFICQVHKEERRILISETGIDEIISFGEMLNFQREEIVEILRYYIKINKINEKQNYLLLLLENYADEGVIEKEWDEDIEYGISEKEADNLIEYLKKDILEIEGILEKFYEQTEDYELTDKQIEKLTLLFAEKQYPEDMLEDVIDWYDINSGIEDKRNEIVEEEIYAKINSRFGKNSIYKILGYEIHYGAEYFFEKYISSHILELSENVDEGFSQLYNKARQERLLAFAEIVIKANNDTIDFIDKLNQMTDLGLSEDICQKLIQYAKNKVEELRIGYEKLNEIDEQEALEKGYREVRKETRGRWQGGGFGISGALKGAVTAGAMNAVGGMAHSAFNAIGNLGTGISANNARKEIVRYYNTIPEQLKRIFEELRISIIKEIQEICPRAIKWRNFSLEEELKRDWQVENEEKQKEIAIKLLQLNPHILENYIRVFQFDSMMTERDFLNLKEIAKIFEIDLEKELLSYFETEILNSYIDIKCLRKLTCIISVLYRGKEKEAEEFEEKIYERARKLLESSDLEKYEKDIEHLRKYDERFPRIKFRIRYQEVIDKKIETIKLQIDAGDKNVKENIEYLMADKVVATERQAQEIDILIRQNEKLQKTVYDIVSNYQPGLQAKSKLSYSNDGKEYEDIEQANLIKNELERIIKLYNVCDISDYDSVNLAIKTILAIYEEIKYGKSVVDELEARLNELDIKRKTVYDVITNYHIGLKEKSELSYSNSGKQYANVKESTDLYKEVSKIFDFYEECNVKDYNSVKQTMLSIAEIYEKTKYGKSVLDEMKSRLDELDIERRTIDGQLYSTYEEAMLAKKIKDEKELQERTVEGIVYATKEEAEKIRSDKEKEKRTVGRILYESEEEAKEARKEADIIGGIKKYCSKKYFSAKSVIRDVEMLRIGRKKNFKTRTGLQWIRILEQDIIRDYDNLMKSISEGRKYGIGSLILLGIDIFITPIGLSAIIAGGIIAKIIAGIILFYAWAGEIGLIASWREMKSYQKELQELNGLIGINNGKVYLKNSNKYSNNPNYEETVTVKVIEKYKDKSEEELLPVGYVFETSEERANQLIEAKVVEIVK